MFSKENRRFLILVSGIVTLAIVTLIVMAGLINKGHGTETAMVTGFTSLLIIQLMAMARQEQQGHTANTHRAKIEEKLEEAAQGATVAAEKAEAAKNEVAETKEVIKKIEKQTNGNLAKALATPAPEQAAMPKTREELDDLLNKVVGKTAQAICDEIFNDLFDEKFAKAFLAGLDSARPSRNA